MQQARASCPAWETGKNAAYPAGPPARRAQAYPAGAGRSPQTEKDRKADMTLMVMSAFLMAASRQRKVRRVRRVFRACNDATLPGARGRDPSGPSAGHVPLSAEDILAWACFWKRRTGRAIGPPGATGYRPSGRTRHDEEEGPSLHGRPRAPAAGQRPPCPAIFFQISLSGMPQARATPAP